MATRLENKLQHIRRVFTIDDIIRLKSDNAYVARYYRANKIAYSIFHSTKDHIHMGFSQDGTYQPDDLLAEARIVENYLNKVKARQVLELATGRGASTAYLAKRYHNCSFTGLDLPEGQVTYAMKKASHLPNYTVDLGDYHDLSRYETQSFDLVFIIEALCYSLDKLKVFAEVHRVLKHGGLFLIFDGYIKKHREEIGQAYLTALQLTEKGMAVNEIAYYPDMLDQAKAAGFKIVESTEVSDQTLPTLYRFERLANRFFAHPHLAKLLTKVLPFTFTGNAISGYLMPDLMAAQIGCYFVTVLEK